MWTVPTKWKTNVRFISEKKEENIRKARPSDRVFFIEEDLYGTYYCGIRKRRCGKDNTVRFIDPVSL